jgi:hypothetical protein
MRQRAGAAVDELIKNVFRHHRLLMIQLRCACAGSSPTVG